MAVKSAVKSTFKCVWQISYTYSITLTRIHLNDSFSTMDIGVADSITSGNNNRPTGSAEYP